MAIRGKAILYTSPDGKKVTLAVNNTGDTAVGVTNNYFPDAANAKTNNAHDDNTRYGHGLECGPGDGWSWQDFPIGGKYHNYTIEIGGYLRLGLRGAAVTVARIPGPNQSVELDLVKDFEWYGSNPQTSGMADYRVNGMNTNVGANNATIKSILGARQAQSAGILVQGKASVTAHEGPGGRLSHWTVRFDNNGDTPFIGTVVFDDAKKNDGIGLESMGVPDKGSAAEQRIEAGGNYGILAKSGLPIRFGIRGWGFAEAELPSEGTVELPTHLFTVETSAANKKFFKHKAVKEKQQEKLHKVHFFQDGKPLNDEIKPIAYVGAEAIANAPFDPPHLLVRGVPDKPEFPGGGWLVELKSTMPNKDPDGNVGFIGTLRLGDVGVDPVQMPPKKFENHGDGNVWFIPNEANIGGELAQDGSSLTVGTRGTGWFATLELPEAGKTISSKQRKTLWAWRPDQYIRDQLGPDFTSQCRLGPDLPGDDK